MVELEGEEGDYQRVQRGLQATTTSSPRAEFERLTELLSKTGIYLPKDEDSIRQALSHQDDGRGLLRWVVARLECLQHLECLQSVHDLIQERDAQRADKDKMKMYGYMRRKGVVAVAMECACSGNLETVGLLLQQYPYTVMPRIMDVLQGAPESISDKEMLRVLTSVMEARRYSPSGPPLRREADVVECEAVCGFLRSWSNADILYTERMAKLNYGWCCPTNHEIESWIVCRALEVDRVTGLYLDAQGLLDMGMELLGHGQEMKKTSMLYKSNILSKEYELYMLLCDQVGRRDTGALPCTMVDFVNASVEQRLECIIGLCLEADGDILRLRSEYIQPLMSLQMQLDGVDDVRALDALQAMLLGYSSVALRGVLDFLMAETSQSSYILDSSSIVRICCEIILSDSAAHDCTMDVLHVAKAALEQSNDSSLMQMVHDVENHVNAASLLGQMGKTRSAAEVARMSPQAWFDVLCEVIDSQASLGVSSGQWRDLWDIIDNVLHIVALGSQYVDKLREMHCQYSLKLGFLSQAEEYLSTVSESTRETLILSYAQELLYDADTSDDAIHVAKKVLGLLPESQKARHEIEFIENITKLRELGIELSAQQLQKSSNTSQMFSSAMHNVQSMEGLQDIEKVIHLSTSLNTGFSRLEILIQLAETAFGFQDAALCEKICLQLVESEARDALPMILKLVESDLEIQQDTRSRLVSFALMGADPKSLLALLGELRKARENDMGGILVDIMEDNRSRFMPDRISVVDERSSTIQIISALSALTSDSICDWMESFIANDDGNLDRALARSVYIGAIAAISIHAIGLALSEGKNCIASDIESMDKLVHIDIAALCLLGSKCITTLVATENQGNILSRLASIMRHAGSSLVATSDQSRVALMHDKDAQDLWATGDVHAQKRALLQLTDKIAASQVGKYGIMSSLKAFSVEAASVEIGIPELADIYLLADRCGANVEELEDVFVKGVLYRHGSTEAFSNSWSIITTQRPLFGAKLAVSFGVEASDISNFEAVRVMEMITQCLHSLSSSDDAISGVETNFSNIYDICVSHAGEDWINMRILLLPVFQVLAHFLNQEPFDGQRSDIAKWVISAACESNASDMFGMIHKLILEYCAIREKLESVDLPGDYPVDASLTIFSALLKMASKICEDTTDTKKASSLLGMLDMRSEVNFGLFLVDPMLTMECMHLEFQEFAQSFEEEALHRLLNIVVESVRHKDAPDETTQNLKLELLYKNALMTLQSELAPHHISDDILSQIASIIVSNANANEVISRIQEILRTFVYVGMAYNSEIGEMVSRIVTLCDNPSIEANALMTGMYLDSLDLCLSALENESNASVEISTGEAIQNIFGVVRSLDGTPATGMDIMDPTTLRSAVYERIGNYLVNFRGHKDIVKSEIQIQLVEMMASLGKDKWIDWEPPSTGFDWSLQGESLLHSRLFSHFSTDWPEALEISSVSPENLATVESVNEAVVAMSKNASTAQQAFSLWTAISSILLPHFRTTDEIDKKLQESYNATLKRVIELGESNNMLFALDEYVGRFGQLGQELHKSAIKSSEPKNQPLIHMIVGIHTDDYRNGANEEILTGMLDFMKSSDVPDSHKLAAIVLAIQNNTISAILDQSDSVFLQDICYMITRASELQQTLTCTTDEIGESFECPIRALICSAFISHLLQRRHNNEASYVAFETVGLCRAFRVKDSGLPVIRAFLSRIRSIHWGAGTYSDLASVLHIPACSALAALIHEIPDRCADALS
ncbi:MAG2-interacting protein 2 [Picochlorum sp. SENEW3]|nr:MAG2-interacting protein 2 [Picochlorum sp. SENEW3]